MIKFHKRRETNATLADKDSDSRIFDVVLTTLVEYGGKAISLTIGW